MIGCLIEPKKHYNVIGYIIDKDKHFIYVKWSDYFDHILQYALYDVVADIANNHYILHKIKK